LRFRRQLAGVAFIAEIADRRARAGQDHGRAVDLRQHVVGEIGLSLDRRQVAAQRNDRRIRLHQQPPAQCGRDGRARALPRLDIGVAAQQHQIFAA